MYKLYNFSDEFLGNPYRNFQSSTHLTLSSLENFKTSAFKENNSNESNMKYIHMIMPLMFETWMEMKPEDESKLISISMISQENAVMLKLIMDIIMELFNMIEPNVGLNQQFLKKYQDSFEKQFMIKFPYTQNDSSKRSTESGGERCIYQNLSIAVMYLNFSMKNQQRFQKYREKVFNYIEESICNWKIKDQEFNRLMKKLIRTLFSAELRTLFTNDSKNIFNEIIKKCNVDQSSYDPKLQLVCEIIEGNETAKQDAMYDKLLVEMINVIAHKDFVPVSLIKTISLLARRNNKVIHEAIEKNAIDIVKNLLTKFKTSGSLIDSDKYKVEVVNLIYWVNDKETLRNLVNILKNDTFSVKLNELILMKLN